MSEQVTLKDGAAVDKDVADRVVEILTDLRKTHDYGALNALASIADEKYVGGNLRAMMPPQDQRTFPTGFLEKYTGNGLLEVTEPQDRYSGPVYSFAEDVAAIIKAVVAVNKERPFMTTVQPAYAAQAKEESGPQPPQSWESRTARGNSPREIA